MRVCIVRNAELESNASIHRIIDAMWYSGNEVITLTRSRKSTNKKSSKYLYRQKRILGKNVSDAEIQLFSKRGSGLKNILSLFTYQLYLLYWFIKNNKKFDAIHSFDLDTGIASVIAAKILNKKIIYHIADFYVDSRSGIPAKIQKYIKKLEFTIINKSNLVIVCTEQRKEQIKGSQPKNLIVIHNTPVVNRKIELPQNNYDNSKLSISYVGGLSKNRFILELLEVIKENDDIKLNIAGYGEVEEEVRKCADNASNINYIGQISYENAMKLYAKSEIIFAMYDPSVKNNQFSAPNKVYEAMYLGKAILVSNGTGVDELVRNEDIGYTLNYTKEDLRNILNHIVMNRDELREKGKNAKASYINYSWDTMKHRLKNAYDSL